MAANAQLPAIDTAPATAAAARPLGPSIFQALLWIAVAVSSLHISYTWGWAKSFVAVYILALIQLARQDRWRLAFYSGLIVGFLTGILHLQFFFTLFSFGAIGLWFVFAFWIGLFAALARLVLRRFGQTWGLVMLPFLWTGLEYFRSELYYLRFSWMTPALAFTNPVWTHGFHFLGVFGIGFLVAAMVCCALAFKHPIWKSTTLAVTLAVLFLLPQLPAARDFSGAPGVNVAGVQMEFPAENEVLIRLRELLRKYPETQLIVLSEYTFDGPIPQKVCDWCATNRVYLIAGGKESAGTNFYNTAFVIDPEGQIVFRQSKAVPIQFMKDGLPARRQQLWDSPWGKIGICICYDLSYTRVTDNLVRQGAQALIVPTMDVIDWGKRQHELHGRIAPARAAEYGLPIFRLASSGISQNVDAAGRILSSAPAGAEGAFIAGQLQLRGPGRLPLDRWLAPACVGVTGAITFFFVLETLLRLARRLTSGKSTSAA